MKIQNMIIYINKGGLYSIESYKYERKNSK
jgi:hypothetical protein